MFCDDLARDFTSGPLNAILSECSPEQCLKRDGELREYYEQAGKLFTRLSTQKSELRWTHPDQMLGKPFDPHTMRPHPLHRIYEDEYDRLDGKLVLLVISPMVSRRGADAGNQDQDHVLAKAVVWLEM